MGRIILSINDNVDNGHNGKGDEKNNNKDDDIDDNNNHKMI